MVRVRMGRIAVFREINLTARDIALGVIAFPRSQSPYRPINRARSILLNGTYSSGKTTLATTFQRAIGGMLYVSNDNFTFIASDEVLKDNQL